jgi:hypothetical protein
MYFKCKIKDTKIYLIGELENIKCKEVLLASMRKISNVHQILEAKLLGSGLLENR